MMIQVGVNKLKTLSYHIDMHIVNNCSVLIMRHCVIVVHIDALMTSESGVDSLMISQSFAAMALESYELTGFQNNNPNDVQC